VENVDVAVVLDDIADILEIQGANRFRVRAYRTAARTVETLTQRLTDLVQAGVPLTGFPGIGKEMERHILELLETGSSSMLTELSEAVPRSVVELVKLGGLGPSRARTLWETLQIESVEMLEQAIRDGRVQRLPGFGERTAEKLLRSIEAHRKRGGRFRRVEVESIVETLLAYVGQAPGVEQVEVAGSYRRCAATVGDVDLLARSDGDGAAVVAHFTAFPGALRVEAAGGTKGSVVLRSGLQVDLRVIPSESFGAALHYFTGSKEHNVRIRAMGVRKGLRINEWGVYRVREGGAAERAAEGASEPDAEGASRSDLVADADEALRSEDAADAADTADTADAAALARRDAPRPGRPGAQRDFGERIGGATEEEVFGALGLAWIPPELREDRGEVEAARGGALPSLITREDIKGDLQMHSTWSDGRYSIETMALACRELGYQYLAITDHSQSLTMTGGLTPEQVRVQWQEIEEVQERVSGITLLRSLEVDILKDGSLDMPDDVLEELDIVVVSVHSFMSMGEAEMTERVLRALQHPQVDVLAHPTGRLLTRRPPYALDVEAVLQAAAELNVAVELNASPNRLDLSDVHVHRAKQLGVKVAIDTDAHTVRELATMRYGIEQARRGWLEPGDVLNAMTVDEFLGWLKRERA
jgi:DNA polymerase (family 10)